MGGSGGWRSPSRAHVNELINQTRDDSMMQSYEVQVNGLLDDTLRELNDRDVDAVREHLDTVKRTLEADQNGVIELLFGGSVRKHTYVDGLSDIDVLVILNRSDLAGKSPQEAITAFADRLRQRFPGTEIQPGKLAVTIRYKDGTEIQILPALKTATGLRISRRSGEGWSNVVRPDGFARKLTSINQSQGGGVVPTIKLFKSLLDSSESGVKLSGYHVESMAIEAFRNYSGPRTRKEMLQHLVSRTTELVKTPIKDQTGQSLHVDDYLGTANSQERARVSHRLTRLQKRIEGADRATDIGIWRELFPDD